jgi:hypothetical protein
MTYDVHQLASKLKWSIHTVRKWIWHLGIKPTDFREKWSQSSRGKRMSQIKLYPESAIEKLRKAQAAG